MRALSTVVAFAALLVLTAAWPKPTGSNLKYEVVDKVLQYLEQAQVNKEYGMRVEMRVTFIDAKYSITYCCY